ncbi:MAG: DUF1353 domain-containing protein [Cyanobacteria bacterium P01_F01_bin.13]
MYTPKQGKVLCDGEPKYLVTMGGKTFSLDKWWTYQDDSGRHWVVPKGFVYDLASIPRWIWWIQWGPWNNGAVIHDFAYSFGHVFLVKNGQLQKQAMSKKEADDLFADVTYTTAIQFEQKTAPMRRIRLMHLAVSLIGRGFWAKSKECQKKLSYGKPLDELQIAYASYTSSEYARKPEDIASST